MMEDSSTFLISSALRGVVDEETLLASNRLREKNDDTKFLESDLLLTINTQSTEFYCEVVEINLPEKTVKIKSDVSTLNIFLDNELTSGIVHCDLITSKKEAPLASLAVELLRIHKSTQREFNYTLKIITI
jgi:hypothetical protein